MKRTIIAAAILSTMAAGAYAGDRDPGGCDGACDPASLNTSTSLLTGMHEDGFILLYGLVSVNASAGATVNNTQVADLNTTQLLPPPQSYTYGTVTIDSLKTNAWIKASGGSKESTDSSASLKAHLSANVSAQASLSTYSKSHSSGDAGYGYAFSNHRRDGSGSGFGVIGGFRNSTESSYSDAKLDASVHANLDASYDLKTHSSTSWSKWGSLSAGYDSVAVDITKYIDTEKPTDLTAAVGNGALTDATGNIGVNIAGGANNVQSNTVALADMSTGSVLGTAQIFSTQTASGYGVVGDFNLVASVGDKALEGATGNVGVNVASGLGNVQNNSLALSATGTSSSSDSRSSGGEVIASDQNCQTADTNVSGTFTGSATLGAGALTLATGNIGVNIASGAGNVQHNGLAIASVGGSK